MLVSRHGRGETAEKPYRVLGLIDFVSNSVLGGARTCAGRGMAVLSNVCSSKSDGARLLMPEVDKLLLASLDASAPLP